MIEVEFDNYSKIVDLSKLVFEDEDDVDMVVEWKRGGGEEDVVFEML